MIVYGISIEGFHVRHEMSRNVIKSAILEYRYMYMYPILYYGIKERLF